MADNVCGCCALELCPTIEVVVQGWDAGSRVLLSGGMKWLNGCVGGEV